MDAHDYFHKPTTPIQRHYEALRAFYHEGLRATDAAIQFGFSPLYFKKLRVEFVQKIRSGINPFFSTPKPGPKKRATKNKIVKRIVALRKQNYSIADIKVNLEADAEKISLNTIDQILKSEGFAPLPKRTRRERDSPLPCHPSLKHPRVFPLN